MLAGATFRKHPDKTTFTESLRHDMIAFCVHVLIIFEHREEVSGPYRQRSEKEKGSL